MTSRTVVIAQNTSLVMVAEDIELYNVETGEYEDLTAPDTCVFRVETSAGSVTEHTGNQQGSTNTYNASHDFDTAGDFTWQVEIVEGSATYVSERVNVTVLASIADV